MSTVPTDPSSRNNPVGLVCNVAAATTPTTISRRFSGSNSKSLYKINQTLLYILGRPPRLCTIIKGCQLLVGAFAPDISYVLCYGAVPYSTVSLLGYSRVIILAWYPKYVTWSASKVVTKLNPKIYRLKYSVTVPLCTVP